MDELRLKSITIGARVTGPCRVLVASDATAWDLQTLVHSDAIWVGNDTLSKDTVLSTLSGTEAEMRIVISCKKGGRDGDPTKVKVIEDGSE
eukprot:m.48302 g.48302  ORF g.48302 m.48302 type:complete len:91 (-) comp15827_c0_seq1:229-501(-)